MWHVHVLSTNFSFHSPKYKAGKLMNGWVSRASKALGWMKIIVLHPVSSAKRGTWRGLSIVSRSCPTQTSTEPGKSATSYSNTTTRSIRPHARLKYFQYQAVGQSPGIHNTIFHYFQIHVNNGYEWKTAPVFGSSASLMPLCLRAEESTTHGRMNYVSESQVSTRQTSSGVN